MFSDLNLHYDSVKNNLLNSFSEKIVNFTITKTEKGPGKRKRIIK